MPLSTCTLRNSPPAAKANRRYHRLPHAQSARSFRRDLERSRRRSTLCWLTPMTAFMQPAGAAKDNMAIGRPAGIDQIGAVNLVPIALLTREMNFDPSFAGVFQRGEDCAARRRANIGALRVGIGDVDNGVAFLRIGGVGARNRRSEPRTEKMAWKVLCASSSPLPMTLRYPSFSTLGCAVCHSVGKIGGGRMNWHPAPHISLVASK